MNQHDIFSANSKEMMGASMTPEQRETYRKLGEALYKDVDFETGQVSQTDPVELAVTEVRAAIRSGLQPSALTPDEVDLMKGVYGEKWLDHCLNPSTDS